MAFRFRVRILKILKFLLRVHLRVLHVIRHALPVFRHARDASVVGIDLNLLL